MTICCFKRGKVRCNEEAKHPLTVYLDKETYFDYLPMVVYLCNRHKTIVEGLER